MENQKHKKSSDENLWGTSKNKEKYIKNFNTSLEYILAKPTLLPHTHNILRNVNIRLLIFATFDQTFERKIHSLNK